MPRITVASQNPVKLNAALAAFQQMFPGRGFMVDGVAVPSGVPDQPTSLSETMTGARTRAENARAAAPASDLLARH